MVNESQQALTRFCVIGRLFFLLICVLSLFPVCIIFHVIAPKYIRPVMRTWHRIVRYILGIQVLVNGQHHQIQDTPRLFVCNHCSYLDIPILGSILDGHFVAKQDIGGMPPSSQVLIGLTQTLLIIQKRGRSQDEISLLTHAFCENKNLILFPEGTTSTGNQVLPFKSSLFESIWDAKSRRVDVSVQPITLTYSHINGIPVTRVVRPYIAWYGDINLMSHLWYFLHMGPVTVQVDFLPPLTHYQFRNRKDLARHAYHIVQNKKSGKYKLT